MSKKRATWALVLLTLVNLLNYIDRYIFSALLPAIKSDLHFTDTQLGLLGSGFIFAYLLVSPIFGWWGDRGPRMKIMSGGLALWSVATAWSGQALSFISQFLTRVFVGVGESAYTVIASPTLADYFPKERRGRTYAIYISAIPIGSALGYLLGGFLQARVGWRASFFVVGGPGLLLSLLLFFTPNPARTDSGAVVSPKVPLKASKSLSQTLAELAQNGTFVWTVLGYAAYTFVVGGLAFWMPTYIVRYFHVSLQRGNISFGAVTVLGGLVGTFVGGYWADAWEKRSGNGYLKVSSISMLAAFPLFCLILLQNDFNLFLSALFVLEVILFICISPVEASVVNSVAAALRSTAMAWNIFVIHVLGDGISRTLLGSVSDAFDLRVALSLCPIFLILAGLFWLMGVVRAWQPMAWPAGALVLPLYQRHRGFWKSGEAIENSIEAFHLAKSQGLQMIELDTHLSKDQIAIVTHDDTLERLYQIKKNVVELTAAELWQMAQIPSLKSVLQDPQVPALVNIELKSGSYGDLGLERAVAQAVNEAGAQSRVLVSSFNPLSLRRASRYLPQVPRALLVTEEKNPKNKIYLRKMWLAFLAKPHLVHLDQDMASPKLLSQLSRRSIPVAVWTVNDPIRAAELQKAGVVSLISDTLGARDRCQ
jgi:glycerophosphoryl diester phosphodiesterase/predicted MFS family arabinose efflux permease